MWLALDIGNSGAKGGLFEGGVLEATFRLALTPAPTEAAWTEALRAAVPAGTLEEAPGVARVGLASVVPAATPPAQDALRQVTGCRAEVVGPAMTLPFALAYETPQTLGADRLAAAAAAWTRYGPGDGLVVLDAGTALTVEVIDAGGTFLGGAIGAGPDLLRRALHAGTAALPSVPLDASPSTPPPPLVGRSTEEALQSGIFYSFVDSARGLIDRSVAALGGTPVVIATGGWSALLDRHIDRIDHVEPHLVLHGIRTLMALNSSPYD